MKVFKGFDKDLECRGFQFEPGGEYEEKEAELCHSGFHACEYPLDIFGYYPPADSRYCEVELEDVSETQDRDDSKVCGRRIKIGAEIGIKGIVEAAVKFTMERSHIEEGSQATGYQGAASATGYQGAASATGDQGAASATGDQGAASATGDQGAASATGDRGAASATGDRGAASATGTQGAASATGDQGAAVAFGIYGKAKAALGGWITIAEWKKDEDYNWQRVDVQTAKVDGETIKHDIWYRLEDGKFVEA